MQEDELLKAYTGINKDPDHPLIKILVSYIKPSYLFKSDVLTPIHLGRAVERENSKDGTITDTDIEWLHKNCIGDDDFEGNISAVNRRVGFLTGTYWAWKNYDKLGNPEYFGSFGYRRLMVPCFINELKLYDAIIPKKQYCPPNIKQHFITSHGLKHLKVMENVINQIYPQEFELFQKYLSGCEAYWFEIYILKKHLFIQYCEWIFPILFELLSRQDILKLDTDEQNKLIENHLSNGVMFNIHTIVEYLKRDIGFIIERLTGYYLYKLTQNKTLKVLQEDIVITKDDKRINPRKEELKSMIKTLTSYIQNLNQEYVIPNLDNYKETIHFISVVNNHKLYNKCIVQNPFIKNLKNITTISYDNTFTNIPISKRYNEFLNTYDYAKPSWFVFCHNDWQLIDDINKKLKNLDKNNIYGPIGVKLFKQNTQVYRLGVGTCYEKTRDSDNIYCIHNNWSNNIEKVDTLDCQAMIVHSSLIQKYNLRFDENLKWDLYVEDFCINANKKYSINTYAIKLQCIHNSNTGLKSLPLSYYIALDYLNNKYPNDLYGGICSLIGGKEFTYMSVEKMLFSKLRYKHTQKTIKE